MQQALLPSTKECQREPPASASKLVLVIYLGVVDIIGILGCRYLMNGLIETWLQLVTLNVRSFRSPLI